MRNFFKKNILFLLLIALGSTNLNAQLQDSCKLEFGTNLGGLADWVTELPFVNLMHSSREWYTKSINDPNNPWNSEQADKLQYREDGYPTHVPQNIDDSPYQQKVATIWAITDGWPKGQYTVLWDGTGELNFWGTYSQINQVNDHKITFDMPVVKDGVVEMIIEQSDINDPIRNIRVLMPGTEGTYEDQPFNETWLNLLTPLKTVRFMDWGQTNNWGQKNPWEIGDGSLVDWDQRSKMDHYTWAYSKGVPYEMMIELLNKTEKDGWVCVPHVASANYHQNMAQLFKEKLDKDRKLYVEYSNEIWNWGFGQAQWANKYGCEDQGVAWPEGTVPYIQNMLDNWTEVFADELYRIERVVGVFTAYQDVAERVAYNVNPETFDIVSPTYYFGLNEDDDAELDALGENATVQDVVTRVRGNFEQGAQWISNIKGIADSLDKKMAFYEGGQHITPHPFGAEPTYKQALLDIQRDTSMYNMYNEWFDLIRDINDTKEPFLLMNFGFIAGRSARYGSWGVLESMYQDTSEIPAPKYQALLDNIYQCNPMTPVCTHALDHYIIYPNPVSDILYLSNIDKHSKIVLYNAKSQLIYSGEGINSIDVSGYSSGIYILRIINNKTKKFFTRKVIIIK